MVHYQIEKCQIYVFYTLYDVTIVIMHTFAWHIICNTQNMLDMGGLFCVADPEWPKWISERASWPKTKSIKVNKRNAGKMTAQYTHKIARCLNSSIMIMVYQ